MNETTLFSILPILPPPIASARPPLTLTRVKTMFRGGAIQICRDGARREGLTHGGNPVPDRLARLSARCDTIHFFFPDEIDTARLKKLVAAVEEGQPGFRLSLCCTIDHHVTPDFIDRRNYGAIVQIQWRVAGPLPDFGFFKAFSRACVWNHLILDGSAASPENRVTVARHPNLIHSWETTRPKNRAENFSPTYGQVRPLPGRPLWQAVDDPVERFLLVDRLSRDQLLRLRIDDDGERLYRVGDNLSYHFVPPNRLPEGCLDDICAMVAAGGTVAATHVRSNLERAFLIGYVKEHGVIVGNSSLKNPRPAYIDSVRRRSGLDLTGYVERGYTSVRPEYRGLGIGTHLLEGLTQRAGDRKIFSVIAEDNAATKVIAMRNRTRRVTTYFSEAAGKPVGIWMPERMIDGNE